MKKRIARNVLLPYEVIAAASEGDVEAINWVVNHYYGYITHLSKRRFIDEYGNCHEYIDEEKRQLLMIKLISKAMEFDASKVI